MNPDRRSFGFGGRVGARLQSEPHDSSPGLHGLKTKGFAVSQKGLGTFVTRPKLEKNIMHLRGFTEDMKHLGMVSSSKLLKQRIVKPTEALAERLRIGTEELVMRLDDNVWPMAFRWRSKSPTFRRDGFLGWKRSASQNNRSTLCFVRPSEFAWRGPMR